MSEDKSEGRGFGGGFRPYGRRPGRGRAVTPSPNTEMNILLGFDSTPGCG